MQLRGTRGRRSPAANRNRKATASGAQETQKPSANQQETNAEHASTPPLFAPGFAPSPYLIRIELPTQSSASCASLMEAEAAARAYKPWLPAKLVGTSPQQGCPPRAPAPAAAPEQRKATTQRGRRAAGGKAKQQHPVRQVSSPSELHKPTPVPPVPNSATATGAETARRPSPVADVDAQEEEELAIAIARSLSEVVLSPARPPCGAMPSMSPTADPWVQSAAAAGVERESDPQALEEEQMAIAIARSLSDAVLNPAIAQAAEATRATPHQAVPPPAMTAPAPASPTLPTPQPPPEAESRDVSVPQREEQGRQPATRLSFVEMGSTAAVDAVSPPMRPTAQRSDGAVEYVGHKAEEEWENREQLAPPPDAKELERDQGWSLKAAMEAELWEEELENGEHPIPQGPEELEHDEGWSLKAAMEEEVWLDGHAAWQEDALGRTCDAARRTETRMRVAPRNSCDASASEEVKQPTAAEWRHEEPDGTPTAGEAGRGVRRPELDASRGQAAARPSSTLHSALGSPHARADRAGVIPADSAPERAEPSGASVNKTTSAPLARARARANGPSQKSWRTVADLEAMGFALAKAASDAETIISHTQSDDARAEEDGIHDRSPSPFIVRGAHAP